MLKESKYKFKELKHGWITQVVKSLSSVIPSPRFNLASLEIILEELVESEIIDQFANLPDLSDFPLDLGVVTVEP